MTRLSLLLLIALMTSCGVSKLTTQNTASAELSSLAIEKFKSNYVILPNTTGNYSLVYKKHKEIHQLLSSVHFFIYDHQSNAVIFEDELSDGAVNWHSSTEVFAISKGKDGSVAYYFDVLTRSVNDAH